MSRRLRPLAALAMVTVIGVGCSKAPAHVDSASNVGNKSSSTRDQAVQFSQCMRDNGIKGFPDPDASGRLTIDGVVNGSSIDAGSAAFERALSACKDLQPTGFTGTKRTASQQQAGLRFAQCVRDNGVKDFPDPEPDGPLIDTNRIPSTEREGGMSALHAAMKKCSGEAASAGVTGGR